MATLRRGAFAILAAGLLSAGSGCTLCKPIVGVFTGPAVILAETDGDWGCGCGDGRALVAAFGVMAAVGAVGGLVTGIISDVQVLTGRARRPTHNWWDPFKTNCGG
jgi:hypothetical protein